MQDAQPHKPKRHRRHKKPKRAGGNPQPPPQPPSPQLQSPSSGESLLDGDSEPQFDPDSQDEGIEDYKPSGYHPAHIGEVLLSRYVLLQKLGWGRFSTVWLAKDFKHDNYVAVKIQKSAPHYLEAAYDEVEILQRVQKAMSQPEWLASLREYYPEVTCGPTQKTTFTRDDSHVVTLLNSFLHRGPYGSHFCFVFEVMGVNLYEVIKRYNFKGVPLHICRTIAKQVLVGLDFLHRVCQVIHTDLKPENVVVGLTQAEIVRVG